MPGKAPRLAPDYAGKPVLRRGWGLQPGGSQLHLDQSKRCCFMTLAKLRVGRPTDGLPALLRFYCEGLGLAKLTDFTAHNGFDGVMLGHPQAPYHLEFTHQPGHTVGRAPTADNLLVFYLPDAAEWQAAVRRMAAAGFAPVPAYNPYWDQRGCTFEDPDGYRVVLQQAEWSL